MGAIINVGKYQVSAIVEFSVWARLIGARKTPYQLWRQILKNSTLRSKFCHLKFFFFFNIKFITFIFNSQLWSGLGLGLVRLFLTPLSIHTSVNLGRDVYQLGNSLIRPSFPPSHRHKVPLCDWVPDIQLATFRAGHGSGIRVSLRVWWRKVKAESGWGLDLGVCVGGGATLLTRDVCRCQQMNLAWRRILWSVVVVSNRLAPTPELVSLTRYAWHVSAWTAKPRRKLSIRGR